MHKEIRILRYSEERMIEWNKFLEKAKNSLFMFDRNYMEYHSERFQDHSLMFYDKDELIGVLPISQHGNSFVTHGGLTYGGMICGESMKQSIMIECFHKLREYCKDYSIGSLLYKAVPAIYHNQPAEEDLFALYREGATLEKLEASTVIRLKEPYKMAKLRKRQINKAAREEVIIEVDDKFDTYNVFMQMQDKILVERHNVNAVHSGAEIYLLHSRFPDNIHLYAARHEGKLIGGAIIFIYRRVVHTQYLCANEEAKEIGALDAVINYIMEEYKETKEWLDFGISTEDAGRYLNEGLISQKEGFGGRTNVYSTWKLNLEIS